MSFIPEKMNSIERALIAAASMAPSDARNVLRLICEGGMTTTVELNEPSEGDKHYLKRSPTIKRMKSSCDRTLNYARHETLRNIEKHFRESPIKSEAEGHPFRGNQYTEGISSDTGKPIKEAPAYRFGAEHSGMMFYSKERDYSEEYATEKGGSIKDVHATTVSLRNPLVIDAPDHKFSSPEYEIPIIKHARASGHDGVVFRNGIDIFYVRFVDFRANPPIHGADSGTVEDPQPSSLAARLTFDRPTFREELLAALAEDQAAALQTSGQQLFDEIGKDSVWRLPSQDATQFVQDRANLLANVPDEVHAEIMQSIEQGLANGESRKDLMARISTAFDEIGKSRAETIANTETAAAFNYARDKAMREAGVTHKRWLHSQSPLIKEPRPTHVEADGQVVPIDDPFDVGGVQFMRPADDSLGAGPEDIINCHCVAIPVEAP